MLLVIDAGNTNTVFAVFEGNELKGQWRLATDRQRTSDEYAIAIKQLMQMSLLEIQSIEGAIISSVVPPLLQLKLYVPLPPEGVKSILPSAPPLQLTSITPVTTPDTGSGSSTDITCVEVHPIASTT